MSHSNHKWLLLIPESFVNKLKNSFHGERREIDLFFFFIFFSHVLWSTTTIQGYRKINHYREQREFQRQVALSTLVMVEMAGSGHAISVYIKF